MRTSLGPIRDSWKSMAFAPTTGIIDGLDKLKRVKYVNDTWKKQQQKSLATVMLAIAMECPVTTFVRPCTSAQSICSSKSGSCAPEWWATVNSGSEKVSPCDIRTKYQLVKPVGAQVKDCRAISISHLRFVCTSSDIMSDQTCISIVALRSPWWWHAKIHWFIIIDRTFPPFSSPNWPFGPPSATIHSTAWFCSRPPRTKRIQSIHIPSSLNTIWRTRCSSTATSLQALQNAHLQQRKQRIYVNSSALSKALDSNIN